MGSDKSGAGYGNHGGDDSMGGQDGAKGGDHVPGEKGTDQRDAINQGKDPSRAIPDDSGTGGYDQADKADPNA